MSGKSMLRFGHDCTRMTIITSHEQRWIDALLVCEQDLTCFTAKEAVAWITDVPNKNGTPRRLLPNLCKLNYTLKKSHMFECITSQKDVVKHAANKWRLIQ